MFFGTAVITRERKKKMMLTKVPQTVQMRTQNKPAHVSFKLGQIQFRRSRITSFFSSTAALSLRSVELSVPPHAFSR